jgi:hypothetical protein
MAGQEDTQNEEKYNQEFINSLENIELRSNTDLHYYLSDQSINEASRKNLSQDEFREHYISFLKARLTDLSSPTGTENLLKSQASKTHDEVNWLNKLRNFMKHHYKQSKDLDLGDYVVLDKIFEKVIDEYEIRQEIKAEREKIKEYEMPIDKGDDYYDIKLQDLQRHKPVRLSKDPLAFRQAYFGEISSRLSNGLSSSEITPFLKYQLSFIKDKLGWLRYIDNMMNSGTRHRDPDPHSNDSLLRVKIPELIDELRTEKEKETRKNEQTEQGELEPIYSGMKEKIKTDLTVPQLALLFKVFVKSGHIKQIIDPETPWFKMNIKSLSKVVSREISSQQEDNVSATQIRIKYNNVSPDTYLDIDEILKNLLEVNAKLQQEYYTKKTK